MFEAERLAPSLVITLCAWICVYTRDSSNRPLLAQQLLSGIHVISDQGPAFGWISQVVVGQCLKPAFKTLDKEAEIGFVRVVEERLLVKDVGQVVLLGVLPAHQEFSKLVAQSCILEPLGEETLWWFMLSTPQDVKIDAQEDDQQHAEHVPHLRKSSQHLGQVMKVMMELMKKVSRFFLSLGTVT